MTRSRSFVTRYHLSAEQVSERAKVALEQMEKAQIGTLHSFAAHLLRLHPMEAEIDPLFQEDDGSRSRNCFTQLGTVGWTMSLD